MVLALFLFAPRPGQAPESSTSSLVQQSRIQYDPWQVLKEPTFWIMYVMFVLMAAGGLMATAQLKPIAKDFHLDTIPVTLIGITLPALTFALTIDRVLNGLTRPFLEATRGGRVHAASMYAASMCDTPQARHSNI